ncbi:MAG: pilin [Candidatus Pacebacteria bacterium]|nr:pilin [Candidatus Paceibacterota bacterium]
MTAVANAEEIIGLEDSSSDSADSYYCDYCDENYGGETAGQTDRPAGNTTSFGTLVSRVVTFSMVLGAILAVVEIVVGGLEYIASAGNPTAKENGKKRITQALLGVLIALLSYAILYTINPDILNTGLGLQPVVIQKAPATSSSKQTQQQTTGVIKESAGECAAYCAPLSSGYDSSTKICSCNKALSKTCWTDGVGFFADAESCYLNRTGDKCAQKKDAECK